MLEIRTQADRQRWRRRRKLFCLMINSAAGLAIIGFILTGILGALITHWVKSIEERQEAAARTVADERASLDRLRSVIDVTLSERAQLIDEISYDVTRDSGESDLQEAWSLYRKSVRDGNVSLWKAQYDLEAVTGMDNDTSSSLVFSNYLNIHVAMALKDEDECLIEAHDSYLAPKRPSEDRVRNAVAELEKCQNPSWDRLRLCMRDLSLNLDEAIALRIRAIAARKKSAKDAEADLRVFYNGAGDSAGPTNSAGADADAVSSVAQLLTPNCGKEPNTDS